MRHERYRIAPDALAFLPDEADERTEVLDEVAERMAAEGASRRCFAIEPCGKLLISPTALATAGRWLVLDSDGNVSPAD